MKCVDKFCILIMSVLFTIQFVCISCKDELGDESNTPILTRAIVPQPFDWENVDVMPTPPTQYIPTPWVGSGSIASTYGLEVVNDIKASDGWLMLYNTFTSSSSYNLVNPYFVLYNKYRGIMRIFFYITTDFVTTSSYLQDGISIISSSKTSLLNFLGDELVDINNDKNSYVQLQPAPLGGARPLAANKWYMLQYEMAYDPRIAKIPYNNIQLSWMANYLDIESVNLGGKATGELKGIIGASDTDRSKNIFSALSNAGLLVGKGALSILGQDFINHNMLNDDTGENKLGLPKKTYLAIYKGIKDAVSSSVKDLPDAGMKILNAILGGGSTTTPISLKVNIDLSIKGTNTKGGALPSTPTSFWVPGTNIPSNAIGYVPLANDLLGVVNFEAGSQDPMLSYKLTKTTYTERNEPFEPVEERTITRYHLQYPSTINYSPYLIINPAVARIAKITIERQDLVKVVPTYANNEKSYDVVVNPIYDEWETGGDRWEVSPVQRGAKYGARFTIKVNPYDGSPAVYIIKTMLLGIDGL